MRKRPCPDCGNPVTLVERMCDNCVQRAFLRADLRTRAEPQAGAIVTVLRDVWVGFSGAFRSIVRCLETVLPPEAAWAVIYLWIWMGVVGLIMWAASP